MKIKVKINLIWVVILLLCVCVRLCVFSDIHVCIGGVGGDRVCVCVCVCMRLHVCMFVWDTVRHTKQLYTHRHKHTHTHAHTETHAHTHARTHKCTHMRAGNTPHSREGQVTLYLFCTIVRHVHLPRAEIHGCATLYVTKGGKPSPIWITPWMDSYYTREHRAAQQSSVPRPIHSLMTCATHASRVERNCRPSLPLQSPFTWSSLQYPLFKLSQPCACKARDSTRFCMTRAMHGTWFSSIGFI